jgi:2-haloacid dehalogenase
MNDSMPGTVELLTAIKNKSQHRLYALTNWSAETFPWALDTFEFLHWFEGIVVSGIEKTRKPHPEFYQILFDRYQIDPATALFIDDNARNIVGAKTMGMHAIHFQNPGRTKEELVKLGVL